VTIKADSVDTKSFVEEVRIVSEEVIKRREGEIIGCDVVVKDGFDGGNGSARRWSGRQLFVDG
jgi:translation initiation factor IF-2